MADQPKLNNNTVVGFIKSREEIRMAKETRESTANAVTTTSKQVEDTSKSIEGYSKDITSTFKTYTNNIRKAFQEFSSRADKRQLVGKKLISNKKANNVSNVALTSKQKLQQAISDKNTPLVNQLKHDFGKTSDALKDGAKNVYSKVSGVAKTAYDKVSKWDNEIGMLFSGAKTMFKASKKAFGIAKGIFSKGKGLVSGVLGYRQRVADRKENAEKEYAYQGRRAKLLGLRGAGLKGRKLLGGDKQGMSSLEAMYEKRNVSARMQRTMGSAGRFFVNQSAEQKQSEEDRARRKSRRAEEKDRKRRERSEKLRARIDNVRNSLLMKILKKPFKGVPNFGKLLNPLTVALTGLVGAIANFNNTMSSQEKEEATIFDANTEQVVGMSLAKSLLNKEGGSKLVNKDLLSAIQKGFETDVKNFKLTEDEKSVGVGDVLKGIIFSDDFDTLIQKGFKEKSFEASKRSEFATKQEELNSKAILDIMKLEKKGISVESSVYRDEQGQPLNAETIRNNLNEFLEKNRGKLDSTVTNEKQPIEVMSKIVKPVDELSASIKVLATAIAEKQFKADVEINNTNRNVEQSIVSEVG